jgi:hypothetical protein
MSAAIVNPTGFRFRAAIFYFRAILRDVALNDVVMFSSANILASKNCNRTYSTELGIGTASGRDFSEKLQASAASPPAPETRRPRSASKVANPFTIAKRLTGDRQEIIR